nr:DNA alkylation repair protein [Duganella qianjiadongensis]
MTALADAGRAAPMRAYLLDQFDFLGIPAPQRRAAIKALPRQVWNNPADVLEIAHLLWERPQREFRYTAIDFLRGQVKLLDGSHLTELLALLRREAWWETVDGMTAVIGLIILQQVKRGDTGAQAVCDVWIGHGDFWVRRCAMLHQLGWRLHTDMERLQRYAELLAPEKEFFIRKAIGWALRDYARWHPAWVKNLLQAQQERFSGLTMREAAKHLVLD